MTGSWLTKRCSSEPSSEWGPWTIVEATDRRHTRLKIARTIIKALEERLGISPLEFSLPVPENENVMSMIADENGVSVAVAGNMNEDEAQIDQSTSKKNR